jgi:hypothetical protein
MSSVMESVSAKKAVSLATDGALIWATKNVIANDNVAAQKELARVLAQRDEWSGYSNGHVGFLMTTNGSWFVAYSGQALADAAVSAIQAILHGAGAVPLPYTFINKVVVHADFGSIAALVAKADRDAGSQIGCAEKKLMSYFQNKGLKPEIATMSAFKISKGGTTDANASWVYPCASCQHCLVHYWNNLRAK